MLLRQTVIMCVLFFETAVLETRNAPKAAGHQVCIVWIRLPLIPLDALESADHQLCNVQRESSP